MMRLRKPLCLASVSEGLSFRSMVVFITLFMSINCFAEEEILSLEGARIRGNQELPNVLYLIPWKPPKVYSLDKTKNTLASSPKFKTLDRSSFKRLVNYHQTFKNKVVNNKASNTTLEQ